MSSYNQFTSQYVDKHIQDDAKHKLFANEDPHANPALLNHRVKADYKPEVFFIGQIVGGTDFPTEVDGLFVEATLKYGESWKMFDKPAIQTHTAYCDDEGFFVWAHPFDFHFIAESV